MIEYVSIIANATASEIANIKEEKENYKLQQTMDPVLAAAIEDNYPRFARDMLEVNYSLDHLSLLQQKTQLLAGLTITHGDIIWMHQDMSKPWNRDAKIESFTADQLQCYDHLDNVGQAPAPLEAIKLMWKSYTSTPADELDFAACMTRFLDRWPAIIDQTPVNFAATIVVYVNTLLPAERAANMARRRALVAHEAIAVVPAPPVPQLIAAVAMAPPAHQHAPGRGAQHAGGGGGRGGGRGGRGAPAGQPRPYCHTHGGPAPGKRGHYSCGCDFPGPNHEWTATFLNQMGGVPAY